MVSQTVRGGMDEAAVVALLRARVGRDSLAFARQHGMSQSNVVNVLAGRARPGPKILTALGLRAVTRYVALVLALVVLGAAPVWAEERVTVEVGEFARFVEVVERDRALLAAMRQRVPLLEQALKTKAETQAALAEVVRLNEAIQAEQQATILDLSRLAALREEEVRRLGNEKAVAEFWRNVAL